jgi:hypothetical protein
LLLCLAALPAGCVHTQNMRKGEFSRAKASGKRAIELGAGMGLAGLAFALIGALGVCVANLVGWLIWVVGRVVGLQWLHAYKHSKK